MRNVLEFCIYYSSIRRSVGYVLDAGIWIVPVLLLDVDRCRAFCVLEPAYMLFWVVIACFFMRVSVGRSGRPINISY